MDQKPEYLEHFSKLMRYVSMYNPYAPSIASPISLRDAIDHHLDELDRMRQQEQPIDSKQTFQALRVEELTQPQEPSSDISVSGNASSANLFNEEPWIQIVHPPSPQCEQKRKREEVLQEDPIEEFDDSDDEFLISAKQAERKIIMTEEKLNKCCPSLCGVCRRVVLFKDAVRTMCNHYYCKKCLDDRLKTVSYNVRRCPTCKMMLTAVTTFRANTKKKHSSKI